MPLTNFVTVHVFAFRGYEVRQGEWPEECSRFFFASYTVITG